MIDVNEADFKEEVMEKSKETPVLVDFWAEWCGPCMMLGPVLEKLEKKYDKKFILARLNVDGNQSIASEYGVSSIPNVKLFKGGKLTDEFVGALPERDVVDFLVKNKCIQVVMP